jgi:AhpD family alkylhydroperoxidase
MAERTRRFRVWKDGYDQLHGLHELVQASGIEAPLLELIRMRVSQINGCAFCIDMHSKDARAAGETEQRLYALSAWRETGFFSPRERAALALAEAVTTIGGTGVPDDVVEEAAEQFSPEELTHVLYAIIEINSWNRLSITTGRPEPGSYEPSTR